MQMDFNYQKAYCTQALPAFNNLNSKQKTAFNELHKIVGDRQQDRSLNIPTCEKTDVILKDLSCLEIAELSRASYFVGHWHPSLIEMPFDNKCGESWKVANVCDQELRSRLLPCHTLEIHEGVLRVTFSSKHCWLWEELGLATEKNIKIFNECGLPFGENSFHKSAKSLSSIYGDKWPDVESIQSNDLYIKYLDLEKDKHTKKLKDLAQAVKNAEKELTAFTWMIDAGINTDNCIYYNHTDTFSFGWREPLSDTEKENITKLMVGFPYVWAVK